MPDKNIAKALKRKIGHDETILKVTEYKIGKQSLLMNPSRRRIFQWVFNHPCTHLREISRALGYSPQTVSWHMRKLSETDLISENVHGKRKMYTPLSNIITTEDCKTICLLREQEGKRVFLAIENNPKATQKKLCKVLDTYQQMLSLVLHKLIISGLVYEEKSGKEKIYSVTNKINELKEEFTKNSEDIIGILMEALSADSLNPKIERSSEDIIIIRVAIGNGESAFMEINKNPIKSIFEMS